MNPGKPPKSISLGELKIRFSLEVGGRGQKIIHTRSLLGKRSQNYQWDALLNPYWYQSIVCGFLYLTQASKICYLAILFLT